MTWLTVTLILISMGRMDCKSRSRANSWKPRAVVQVRSDGGLDQGSGGGGNGEKNPTGAPCTAQAHLLTRPCHQNVLTNLQYREACPHFRALLESPLPGSLLQTMPVPRGLSEVVYVFCTAHPHTWCFSMALVHSWRCLHFSCCLAFSL